MRQAETRGCGELLAQCELIVGDHVNALHNTPPEISDLKHLVKPELDVGLVTADADAARAFYRDIMGFEEQPVLPLGGGSTQYRFKVGNHLVKINAFAPPPPVEPGGVELANGFRLLAFILDDL